MKFALDIIGIVAAGCCVAPAFLLFIESLAALLPSRNSRCIASGPRVARVAILIPAHNEASTISETIASLAPQLTSKDCVVVVADNCDDATADLAKRAGAKVVVRNDPDHRGKGFALAAGVDYLRALSSAPDVVIVFDADCRLSADGVDILSERMARSKRPVQSSYRMVLSGSATLQDRISAFAFLVKCHVRSLGRERMGWPCHLMGTGMAFPWSVISTIQLASDNIVEDMAMGLDLVVADHAPVFEPNVTVTSAAAVGSKAAMSQRKRWEHGHLQTIGKYVPRLIWYGLCHFRLSPILMACDLAVPPLALLSVLWVFVQLSTLAILPLGCSALPALICFVAGSMLAIAIIVSWHRFARSTLPFTMLLLVPVYIFAKLPIYLGFLRGRRSSWVRTARAGEVV